MTINFSRIMYLNYKGCLVIAALKIICFIYTFQSQIISETILFLIACQNQIKKLKNCEFENILNYYIKTIYNMFLVNVSLFIQRILRA